MKLNAVTLELLQLKFNISMLLLQPLLHLKLYVFASLSFICLLTSQSHFLMSGFFFLKSQSKPLVGTQSIYIHYHNEPGLGLSDFTSSALCSSLLFLSLHRDSLLFCFFSNDLQSIQS